MKKIIVLGCLLGTLLFVNTVRVEAQITSVPAQLDPAFTPGTGVGAGGIVFTSALQPDGKIIIAGEFGDYNGTAVSNIARLNSNGTLDATFNVGTGLTGGRVLSVVRQPDGKIIAVGFFDHFNGTPVAEIVRINPDGSLDSTFTPGTATNGNATDIALQPDGKIIIVGRFTSYTGTSRNNIARINPDGSLDTSFNPGAGVEGGGVLGGPVTVIVQPWDGKIIVGGQFDSYNGTPRTSLARVNPDGTLDSTFNIGAGVILDRGAPEPGIVYSLALRPDGKIFIGGLFTNYNGATVNCIARLNSDGSLDATFNSSAPGAGFLGADTQVMDIALQPDGKIVLGGFFTGYNSQIRPRLARVNPNGSLDDTFDTSAGGAGLTSTGITSFVFTVQVQPDRKIFAGGLFDNYSQANSVNTPVPGVARFLPATGGAIALSAPNIIFGVPLFISNEGASNAPITFKRQLGNDGRTVVKISLAFTHPTTPASLADFIIPPIGTLDKSFSYGSGKGTNNTVNAVAVQPDGKILVGGEFTGYNGDLNASDGILRLNADGSLDTTFNYGLGKGTFGGVNAIVIEPGGKILIGGAFAAYNGDGSASDCILRLNSDGSLDTTFNYGKNGANGIVNAIALQPDGKILVGGELTGYNEDLSASDRVMRLNQDGSLDKAFFNYGATRGANGTVFALAVQTDGKILVGGQFTTYNSDPKTSSGIMRLDEVGALDTSFNYGNNLGANAAVRALCLQDDGKVIIGGDFQIFNSDASASDRILRLNANGSLDNSFNYGAGNGANGAVRSVALEADGKVVIGGDFTGYNSDAQASDRVLRLNADGSLDTAFNYGASLGADNSVNALLIQGDGKILIGGIFSSHNGDANAGDNIARLGGELYITWESGDFSTKPLLLPLNDDTLEEPTEFVNITPSVVYGDSIIGDITLGIEKNGSLGIEDNDLTISLVSGSGVLGGPATLTAKLTHSGSPLNNKTVNFLINGTQFGQAVTNSSGVATFTGGTLTGVGTGTLPNGLTASFPGDSTYAAESATGPLSVNKGDQTITLLPFADRPFNAPDFIVSATASSGLPVALGVIGDCTIGGPTQNIVHLTRVGTCTVVAAQAGDANFNPAPTVTQSFNITKADQTITFGALPDKIVGDPDFTVSATATSGLPVGFGVSGNCTITGNTVHLTGAGSCTVTASQGGDSNYNAAANVARSFTIKSTQTITFNALANKAFNDPDFIVSATASSGLPVSFAASGQCTITGNTVHLTGVGSCAITASQAGNASFIPATDVSQSFNIVKANQTITFGPLTSKTYGDADFTVSATTSASGLSVSFGASGQCSVTGNTVHLTGAGSCTVTASQGGDSNYNAAANVQQSFQIAKAATAAALSSSTNPSNPGQSVTFTATITSIAGTPTGTVQFAVDGTNTGSPVSLNSSGVATFSTSSLSGGTHVITAAYSGDTNFAASDATLAGGQVVNIQTSVSINDVQVTEGNSGTTSAVFSVTLSQASNQTVTVSFATADGTATASGNDYQSATGTLVFNPGDLTRSITIQVNGDTANETDETFKVNLTNPINTALADAEATGTILNDDAPGVQLSSSTYQIREDADNTPQRFTLLSIDVIRVGDISAPATVKYITSDNSGGNECGQFTGFASQRCDYTLAGSTLRFAAGEASKTITIPIINDGYKEGNEVFTLQLLNPVGMSLGVTAQAAITIEDDDTTATAPADNPYLKNSFFVRMNYLDYLGRDTDQLGFADWTNVLDTCGPQKGFLGAPKSCDRMHVSHGFSASSEFTDSGFFIYRLFQVGLNRMPRYREFIPDMAGLSGFNVPAGTQQQNIQDYLQEFTGKQEFTTRFQGALLPSQAAELILRLEQTAQVTLPATATTRAGQPQQYGRAELIQKRESGVFTIEQTLKAFVEQQPVYDKYFCSSQVTILYFAHLRRDPDLNDPNLLGWNDWVDVFTNGRPAQGIAPRDIHHLIFGFIYSEEYRKRFGAP